MKSRNKIPSKPYKFPTNGLDYIHVWKTSEFIYRLAPYHWEIWNKLR